MQSIKGYKRGKNGHSAHKVYRRGKYARYLTRATCIACNKVFKSPKKRLMHIESGHKSEIGWNPYRSRKTVSF